MDEAFCVRFDSREVKWRGILVLLITAPQGFNPFNASDMLFESVKSSALQLLPHLFPYGWGFNFPRKVPWSAMCCLFVINGMCTMSCRIKLTHGLRNLDASFSMLGPAVQVMVLEWCHITPMTWEGKHNLWHIRTARLGERVARKPWAKCSYDFLT